MTDHYFSPGDRAVQPRPLEYEVGGVSRSVVTSEGVFSADGLDRGTRVLLETVGAPPAAGDLLDLGCGWGPIAIELAAASPNAHVWGVDVNPIALDLLRRNASAASLANVTAALPEQVPEEVRFDAIWSNPAIRIGKPALHAMLELWLARLSEDGTAWFVVQKHLGADSLVRWLDALPGFAAERADSRHNYRVLRVVRQQGSPEEQSSPE